MVGLALLQLASYAAPGARDEYEMALGDAFSGRGFLLTGDGIEDALFLNAENEGIPVEFRDVRLTRSIDW